MRTVTVDTEIRTPDLGDVVRLGRMSNSKVVSQQSTTFGVEGEIGIFNNIDFRLILEHHDEDTVEEFTSSNILGSDT